MASFLSNLKSGRLVSSLSAAVSNVTPKTSQKNIHASAVVEAVAVVPEAWIATVDLIQARNLRAADATGTSDPYVLVSLLLEDGSITTAHAEHKAHPASASEKPLSPVLPSPFATPVAGAAAIHVPELQRTVEKKSKIVTKTLNPVFNERFDFVCLAKPVGVVLRVNDFDMSTKDDVLGWLQRPLTDADWRDSAPSWCNLADTTSGEVQFKVSIKHQAGGESGANLHELSAMESVGITTLSLDSIQGFTPGPHALKLLSSDALSKGNYAVKVIITFGLRNFNSSAVPGVPVDASRRHTSGAGAIEAPNVPLTQDCRMWVREDERKYIAQITVYAQTSDEDGRRLVPLGRAYLNTAPLQDGKVQEFRVTLFEESEADMVLTDAEHTDLLVAADKAARHVPLHHAASLSEGNVEIDGSGFRVVNDESGATPTVGIDMGEDGSSAEAIAVTESTEGRGVPVGRLVLRGLFQPREKLETWFLQQLIAQFDTNDDKSLDIAEVIGMLEALGHSMAPAELSALFTKLDASGDGKLDTAEILRWFRSAEFQTTPFAVSLLSFLSDGREGLQHVFNDITDVAKSSEKKTRSGAAVLVLDEGHKSLTVDQGLKVLDRETGLIMTEHIPQFVKMAIGLMYNGIGNRLTGSAAVRGLLKRLSEKEGAIMNSPDSRKKIAPFIRGYNINVAECKKDVSEYKNFNEFFYRELKPEARPITALDNDSVAVSPADCRMVVYQTTSDTTEVWVKGAKFTIEALLGPECADVASLFVGGGFCLARLAPQDYHRYHVPVAGEFWRHHSIDGALFTVNPIAVRQAKPGIYTKNKRDVYLIKTREFGLVAMVAVGATVVGSINTVSTQGAFLERGNDHGYFAFGGSTILVLFQPGTIQFDEDLLSNSRRPLETFVRVGNQVGVATNPTGNHTLGLLDSNAAWATRRAATTRA